MNSDNSQIGHTPSEQIFENNTNEIDITQILSTELVTIIQPFVKFNTTDMIPSRMQVIGNVVLHNTTATRQEIRRRRRQRQRQRRRQRQEEERRIEQHQLEQVLGRSRREYQRWQQQRLVQWEQPRTERQQEQQRVLPPRHERSRTWSENEYEYRHWARLGYPEYLEEFDDELLKEYVSEKTDPRERWEQEQLGEFEGFAALEQLLLMQDEIEQDQQIKTTKKMLEEEQEEVNQEQYIQLQLWEHAAFVVQELNQI